MAGAAHGRRCAHRRQPPVPPQGVAVMRQPVVRDVRRGTLRR
ncbi:hypothetical protein [Kitasatospora sp. HPMI-4]